jgi:hypothetical protein
MAFLESVTLPLDVGEELIENVIGVIPHPDGGGGRATW